MLILLCDLDVWMVHNGNISDIRIAFQNYFSINLILHRFLLAYLEKGRIHIQNYTFSTKVKFVFISVHSSRLLKALCTLPLE